ncbi:MAG: D-2-hydroxyacid dehydrogenase [Trichlorobacter sp.]|uniref:D-2-hydroxyacid dehydrogenase n=1 Tax=Trichlorobacter sp. TaxID=2911007 RepID=UPI0025677FEC|nr:D-2-hydroxyacid dehydrogenase [Trichlorobacter sp.]MDK9717859.1 D-2-hydroxyacid dehydrogenase [Trichlorobacter sp.]
MNITNLLINLQNKSVAAFSGAERHIRYIQEALPGCTITVAEGKTEFLEKLPAAEVALVWSFKPEWYALAPKLKAVFTPAAGHDWVAEDPTGRVQTFYGSFHGRIMRESLLSMMLYFNRRIGASVEDQKQSVWGRDDYSSCVGLFSQQVLIIGCGALGTSMAELLKAFGARVTGVRRTVPDELPPCIDSMTTFDRLEEELPHADHLVLLLPGEKETDGIFTAQHFAAMKPGAFLYNLGRGNCYQEQDLLTALTQGPLAGAGLDVFAHEPLASASPLWKQRNVLITPHSSAVSWEYIDLFIQEWLERLREL